MGHHPIAQFRNASEIVARQVAVDLSLRRAPAPRPLAPNAADLRLADELRLRRQALGLTVGELSDNCGIDTHSLSEWERGIAAPRLDAATRWAHSLGLRLALVPRDSAVRHRLTVEWQTRRVSVDGSPVRLTPMEWKALERLAQAPGEIVSHQALFQHLYGDSHPYRAQSTAIRVLITKLRRLLPLRIEAQWGKGYVLRGIDPASGDNNQAGNDQAGNAAGRSAAADPVRDPAPDHPASRSEAASSAAPRVTPTVVAPVAPAVAPAAAVKTAAAAPVRKAACRAEELGVIEQFLAERGVTRCPDVATIQSAPLPTLVWDKVKRKWVRPPANTREAV